MQGLPLIDIAGLLISRNELRFNAGSCRYFGNDVATVLAFRNALVPKASIYRHSFIRVVFVFF